MYAISNESVWKMTATNKYKNTINPIPKDFIMN